jgi:hypothetical protein
MRRLVTICTVIAVVGFGSAAAEPWKASIDANVTLTQNAYSDNWVGGDVGSLAWVFSSNSLAERQLSSKVSSKSTLKLFFGQTHSQNQETKAWQKPVKSTDLIDFETVFRLTLGVFVDPFMSGRIESQFLDASNPTNERLLNPALFTESVGVARVLTKADAREWSVRLGGALRENLNRNARDPVTGDSANETATDGGILFVSDFATPLAENRVTITSKLSVYKAFYFSEKNKVAGTPAADYWKTPDVNWENILTANITKYLMVNLYVQLLYDKEVDLAGRFKQTLSLGLTYKWSR